MHLAHETFPFAAGERPSCMSETLQVTVTRQLHYLESQGRFRSIEMSPLSCMQSDSSSCP